MNSGYESYKIDDFLNDEFFIEWVKYQTPVSEKFWNEWMEGKPGNLATMQEARLQLLVILSSKPYEFGLERKERIWNQIDTLTRPSKVRWFRYDWTIAAAAVVIIVFSVLFWNHNNNNNKPALQNISRIDKDVITPGKNQAVLTLADGRRVLLDSATIGNIANQGGVNVLKENGSLAYLTEGITDVSSVINKISTPRGGQYKVVLADGSKVWLNAESELTFPSAFIGNDRRVELKGEGYFEVAHNVQKPFYVKVNGMEVKVLGTEFNINSYPDESGIKTTLVNGSVRIHAGDQTTVITPGQQAILKKGSEDILVKDVDVESQVSWKNGKFIFQDIDIYSVMRQLTRWYNIDVVYGQGLPNEQFVGVISRNVSISEVLSMLESTEAVSFRIQGRRVYVEPFKK